MHKILLFATNFMPYPTSQGKNMWLHFAHCAGELGVGVHVLSLNNDMPGIVSLRPDVSVENIPAVMLGKKGRSTNPVLLHRKMTRLPFGQIYQTLTTLRYNPKIMRLCLQQGIRVVHFPQPLGFGIRRLKRRLPAGTKVTMSFSTYIERMGLLSRFYRYLKTEAIRHADIVMVPNEAVKKTAVHMGICESKLKIVRWAVNGDRPVGSHRGRAALRVETLAPC